MMKKIFAPITAAVFAAGMFAALSGCNTMEGMGKDVEKGGKEIKEEARENKKY